MSEWKWELKGEGVYKDEELFVSIDDTDNSVFAVGVLVEELNKLEAELADARQRAEQAEAENARLRKQNTELAHAVVNMSDSNETMRKAVIEATRITDSQGDEIKNYNSMIGKISNAINGGDVDTAKGVISDHIQKLFDIIKGADTAPVQPLDSSETVSVRFVVATIAYDKYTGEPSRWGIIDNDNNHYLADGEADDPATPYSHVETTYGAWEFLRKDSAQARADELNASDD